MASNDSWKKIFDDYKIHLHNFDEKPYVITAEQIKQSCQGFRKTSDKEVRILCKQDSREDRPQVFIDKNLFILPKTNGEYYIVKGEGYVDIADISTDIIDYDSKLDFELVSSKIGDSEMQYLDFAYASSLIRTFVDDSSLVLTIRGRKYTPQFSFRVGSQILATESVQTEVDAGYEGRDSVVLIEAKNSKINNTIIRQLYYPYRQWLTFTHKPVIPLFFEKQIIGNEQIYCIWQYDFTEIDDYNSIQLVRSGKFRISR